MYTQINKQFEQEQSVSFFDYKSKYVLGESIVCSFTVPSAMYNRPVKSQDTIYIFPYGWCTANDSVAGKPVKPEYFWTSGPSSFAVDGGSIMHGKVEFPSATVSIYAAMTPLQFVYVKDGQVVGKSELPFYIDYYSTHEQQPMAVKFPTASTDMFYEQKWAPPSKQRFFAAMHEHVNIEKSHHYLDKLIMLSVLKTYETRADTLIHNEATIRAHLISNKLPEYTTKYNALLQSLDASYQRIGGGSYKDVTAMTEKYEREIMAQVDAKMAKLSGMRKMIVKCEKPLRKLVESEARFYDKFNAKLNEKLAKTFSGNGINLLEEEEQQQLWKEYLAGRVAYEQAEQLFRLRLAEIESEWKQATRIGEDWSYLVYPNLNIPGYMAYYNDEKTEAANGMTTLLGANEQRTHFYTYPYYYDYTYSGVDAMKQVLDKAHYYAEYEFEPATGGGYPLFFNPVAERLAELKAAIVSGGDSVSAFFQHIHKFHNYFEKLGGEFRSSSDQALRAGLFKQRECLYKLRELEAHLVQFLGGGKFGVMFTKKAKALGPYDTIYNKYKAMVVALRQLVREKIVEFMSMGGVYYPFWQLEKKSESWLNVEREMIAVKTKVLIAAQYSLLYSQLKNVESAFRTSPQYRQFKTMALLFSHIRRYAFYPRQANIAYPFTYPKFGYNFDSKFSLHEEMYSELTELLAQFTATNTGLIHHTGDFFNSKSFKYFHNLAESIRLDASSEPETSLDTLISKVYFESASAAAAAPVMDTISPGGGIVFDELKLKPTEENEQDGELFGYGGLGIYKDEYKYKYGVAKPLNTGYYTEAGMIANPWAEIKRLEEENFKLSKFLAKQQKSSFGYAGYGGYGDSFSF